MKRRRGKVEGGEKRNEEEWHEERRDGQRWVVTSWEEISGDVISRNGW